jgi:hypothetical protein
MLLLLLLLLCWRALFIRGDEKFACAHIGRRCTEPQDEAPESQFTLHSQDEGEDIEERLACVALLLCVVAVLFKYTV